MREFGSNLGRKNELKLEGRSKNAEGRMQKEEVRRKIPMHRENVEESRGFNPDIFFALALWF